MAQEARKRSVWETLPETRRVKEFVDRLNGSPREAFDRAVWIQWRTERAAPEWGRDPPPNFTAYQRERKAVKRLVDRYLDQDKLEVVLGELNGLLAKKSYHVVAFPIERRARTKQEKAAAAILTHLPARFTDILPINEAISFAELLASP